MFVGLFARLLAVIFAKGFMMVDDHFLIMEVAGSWADGADAKAWLPWTDGNKGPGYSSFLYVGVIWLFVEGLQKLGLSDPEEQMLWIRLIHAFYSLFTIYFGYKLAERLGGWKSARMVGLFLALLAFLPNFGVRQLVEMVCIPPLIASVYYLVKARNGHVLKLSIYAGIAAGLAVGIRYQSGIFVVGIVLALLVERRWKSLLVVALVSAIIFSITQLPDYWLWKRPFAHLIEYVKHNLAYKDQYVNGPWYRYLLTIAGFLVPPISVLLIFGMARRFKRDLIIVLPVLLFLIFHSAFPNKQERFILPILPFIAISGIVGWRQFIASSSFWIKRLWLNKVMWGFFWVVNVIALGIFTMSFSHKSHVESMLWLGRQADYVNFVQEFSHTNHVDLPPRYYLDNWNSYYVIDNSIDIPFQRERQLTSTRQPIPNYVLFYQRNNIEERVYNIQEIYGPLQFQKKFDPSRLDRLLHDLNPHNRLEEIYVYKVMPVTERKTPKYLE